jgi:hypothetical protein
MNLKSIGMALACGTVAMALAGGVQAKPFKSGMRDHDRAHVEIELSLEDALNQLVDDYGIDLETLKPGRGLVSVTLMFKFSDAWATSPIREEFLGLKGLLEDLKVDPTEEKGRISFLIASKQGRASLHEFREKMSFSSLVVERPKEKTGYLDLMMVKFGGQEIAMFDDAGERSTMLTMEILPVPVPEPGTYALMGAGLGLVGFSAWRRRRTVVS